MRCYKESNDGYLNDYRGIINIIILEVNHCMIKKLLDKVFK